MQRGSGARAFVILSNLKDHGTTIPGKEKHPMKKQEIFDAVVKHLLAAPARSVNHITDTCVYRGPNGSKCAVGAILPDEIYDPKFDISSEGTGIHSLCEKYSDEIPYWMRRNVMLLQELQRTHDDPENWYDKKRYMIQKLHRIAMYFGLNRKVLPRLP